MRELVGWVGSFFFAVCCIPQTFQCWKQGHGRGLNWAFLITWLLGELCMIYYIWPNRDWPLLVNYIFNLLCLLGILKYKIWERE